MTVQVLFMVLVLLALVPGSALDVFLHMFSMVASRSAD